MLKCKTREKEKFHDIAFIISREIYVFCEKWVFSGSRKQSTLAKGPFSALVRHTDIVRYQFSLLLLIFTTVCLKTGAKQLVETINILKIHSFSRSTLEAAVIRTPES